MSSFADRSVPDVDDEAEAFDADMIERHLAHLDTDRWVVEDGWLVGTFPFDDFADALAFTNAVGELAEEAWHHPDIHLSWGEVGIEVRTHELEGLWEADFVLAAKIDQLYDADDG